jgi:hypothetical protein
MVDLEIITFVVSLMLNSSMTRSGQDIQVDVRKVHLWMGRLQKIGQSGIASLGLGLAAVSSLMVATGMAWVQWPGMTVFMQAPMMAGISVASLIFGIIGASLFGLAAMVAGSASEIRVRAAITLARLRAMEVQPALASGLS